MDLETQSRVMVVLAIVMAGTSISSIISVTIVMLKAGIDVPGLFMWLAMAACLTFINSITAQAFFETPPTWMEAAGLPLVIAMGIGFFGMLASILLGGSTNSSRCPC